MTRPVTPTLLSDFISTRDENTSNVRSPLYLKLVQYSVKMVMSRLFTSFPFRTGRHSHLLQLPNSSRNDQLDSRLLLLWMKLLPHSPSLTPRPPPVLSLMSLLVKSSRLTYTCPGLCLSLNCTFVTSFPVTPISSLPPTPYVPLHRPFRGPFRPPQPFLKGPSTVETEIPIYLD